MSMLPNSSYPYLMVFPLASVHDVTLFRLSYVLVMTLMLLAFAADIPFILPVFSCFLSSVSLNTLPFLSYSYVILPVSSSFDVILPMASYVYFVF